MKEIIDVFRMNEISPKTRAIIIIKLGQAINDEHSSNITEAIVHELVSILDPENPILVERYFKGMTITYNK